MASTWMIHQAAAAALILLLAWRDGARCGALTVDPPEDLAIVDPGHFGRLEITWSPPSSLVSGPDCALRYQLECFDPSRDTWSAVRTPRTSYSAQFDLMKDVRVRVSTLLSGACTNGTTVASSTSAEVVMKPSSTGVAVQDVACVFHNLERFVCTWGRNPKMPASAQPSLYFWHKKLEHAEECPRYVVLGGVRTGCDFTERSLPDFTDINFCVNGSSHEGPLKPTFFSLQTQDRVKPEKTDKLHLRLDDDAQLEVHWEVPTGGIPADCLEWEVEHSREGPDGGLTTQQISTQDLSLTLTSVRGRERNCFRVRSKLHKYCVARSFWSEWSPPACHPVFQEEDEPEPRGDTAPVYVYAAGAIIASLMLVIAVWAVLQSRRSRQKKEPDSLLTTLFARSSVLTVVEV